MKKAREYRQHAAECRALARSTPNEEHRVQFLKMADTWEALAAQREHILSEQRCLDEGYYDPPSMRESKPSPHA